MFFFTFCDIGLFCMLSGAVLALCSDIREYKKKKHKKLMKASNIVGIGSIVCAVLTTMAYFVGI